LKVKLPGQALIAVPNVTAQCIITVASVTMSCYSICHWTDTVPKGINSLCD